MSTELRYRQALRRLLSLIASDVEAELFADRLDAGAWTIAVDGPKGPRLIIANSAREAVREIDKARGRGVRISVRPPADVTPEELATIRASRVVVQGVATGPTREILGTVERIELRVGTRLAAFTAEGLLERVAAEGFRTVTRDMAQQIGIPIASARPAQAAAFRDRNLRLIRTLADDQVGRLSQLLRDNPSIHPNALRPLIQKEFEVSRSRADLLARDQTLKYVANLRQVAMTENGITRYVWRTSGDERVREAHADLDGQEFAFADPPVTNEQGEANNPGEDYQCRCTPDPVLPESFTDPG